MDTTALALLVISAMENYTKIEEYNPITDPIIQVARIDRSKAIPYLVNVFDKINKGGLI